MFMQVSTHKCRGHLYNSAHYLEQWFTLSINQNSLRCKNYSDNYIIAVQFIEDPLLADSCGSGEIEEDLSVKIG